jgi:hypothetical protein
MNMVYCLAEIPASVPALIARPNYFFYIKINVYMLKIDKKNINKLVLINPS